MSYLTAVLIINFVISRSEVSCQSNQQICIQEKKTECQNVLRDKIKDLDIRQTTSQNNHVFGEPNLFKAKHSSVSFAINFETVRFIVKELCCPVIEARDCITKAFSTCELSTIPKTRYSLSPSDCKQFDDGVSCDYATITRNKHEENNRSGRYSSDNKNGERESDGNAKGSCCCEKFSVFLLISLLVLLFSA